MTDHEPDEHVVPRWSACFRTALPDRLAERGLDPVVICGCNHPSCPRATAFGATECDFRVAMTTDALSGWGEQAGR